MNMYATPGTKVTYLGKNGYESDKLYADQFLKTGQVYTVLSMDVDDWSSTVTLVEFPNKEFNTVMFSDGSDDHKVNPPATTPVQVHQLGLQRNPVLPVKPQLTAMEKRQIRAAKKSLPTGYSLHIDNLIAIVERLTGKAIK